MDIVFACAPLHTLLLVLCALPVIWLLNAMILSHTRGMILRELCTLPLFTLGILATIWIIFDAMLTNRASLRSQLGIHHLITGIDAYSASTITGALSWRNMIQICIFAIINGTISVALLSIPVIAQSSVFQSYSSWVMTHLTSSMIIDDQLCTAMLHVLGIRI